MPYDFPDDWHTHVDDIMETILEANITDSMRAKESLVANGPEDLPALFVWHLNDGKHLPVPIGMIAEEIGMHPADILGKLIPQLRKHTGGPPILAALGFEAWTHSLSPDRRPIPEEEAIVLVIASPRRAVYACVPFSYGDGGVVWGEVVTTRCLTSELVQFGDMCTALWSAFIVAEAN